MKIIYKNLILFSISICISLLILEVLVRFGFPQYIPLWRLKATYLKADAALGYIPKPNQDLSTFDLPNDHQWFKEGYKTNSDGLFDYEHGEKSEERILGLGDSFFQGYSVPYANSLLVILEKLTQVEIIKAGIAGYGTEQELMLYKRLHKKYNPDIVLVGFYINDVYDNLKGVPRFDDGLARHDTKSLSNGFEKERINSEIKRMVKRSALFELVIHRTENFSPWIRRILFKHNLVNYVLPDIVTLYAVNYTKKLESGWKKTFDLIKAFQQVTSDNGSKLVIIMIPDITQVEVHYWKKMVDYYFLDESLYDVEKPNRLLLKFCRDNNIPFLDLLPLFRSTSKKLYVDYQIGAHWNKEGNLYAAQSIKKWLLIKGLINR